MIDINEVKHQARLAAVANHGHRDLYKLVALDVTNLLDLKIAVQRALLGKWLRERNLAMIHAYRGVGKTWWSLSVAFAVSAGGEYLGWKAPEARKVLYLDGEMAARQLQDRLRMIDDMSPFAKPGPGMLKIFTPELQDGPLPDLATPHGQAMVDDLIEEDTALIVVDNISALVRNCGSENDAESWMHVSEWALTHRRAGRSILFVHHSGKSGKQRGTSKREDLLDTVIQLRHSADYQSANGAAFEIHFEKARGLYGEDVQPIEATLIQDEHGAYQWTVGAVSGANAERVVDLWNLGLSVTEISREIGLHKSNVTRNLQKAAAEGKLTRPYQNGGKK